MRAVRNGRREKGYALLMVVFLAALMMIAVVTAAPSILTQGKREKEEETIWRGQQYARAVRLFYRKSGRFPQSMEDLTKAKNDIRFLRKAYSDPMNAKDGTWRLIYITPSGQLVGSVKRQSLLQIPPPAGQAAQAGQPGKPVATGETEEGEEGAPKPPARAPGTGPTPTQTPTAAGTETGTEGKVFGGNIIGVGSKVNRTSLRVYDGGTTYREWEFIWDPTKETAAGGQAATPAGQAPGTGATPQQVTPPARPQ